MLKVLSQLEHVIGDRIYHFVCEPSSPIVEVKDALIKFMQYVAQVEDKAKEDQAKAEAEQPKEEEKPADPVVEPEQPKQE